MEPFLNSGGAFRPQIVKVGALSAPTKEILLKYSLDLPYTQTGIEQNRCAMACQGCDAVFLFLNKKQWKPSPNSSIVKSPQPTIKQDRHYHCL